VESATLIDSITMQRDRDIPCATPVPFIEFLILSLQSKSLLRFWIQTKLWP